MLLGLVHPSMQQKKGTQRKFFAHAIERTRGNGLANLSLASNKLVGIEEIRRFEQGRPVVRIERKRLFVEPLRLG